MGVTPSGTVKVITASSHAMSRKLRLAHLTVLDQALPVMRVEITNHQNIAHHAVGDRDRRMAWREHGRVTAAGAAMRVPSTFSVTASIMAISSWAGA